jgi:beta-lactamase regulating signal transducer with metallopeptidase domain
MLLTMILWNALLATALAVIAALVGQTAFFRRRPAVMHLLWFAVLVKLVVPPLVPIPFLSSLTPEARRQPIAHKSVAPAAALEIGRPSARPAAASAEVAATPAEWSWQPDLFWSLLTVSLAGTVLFLARFVRIAIRVERLLRTAQPAPEWLAALAAGLAGRLGISPVPIVQVVEAAITPVLRQRGRRASIIFPRRLADDLDDDQITCVLSHELAHLVRHDVAWNLAALAVVALFWWHPVAWWGWSQMQARQEECCDALAIAGLPRSRRLYAQTLLQAVDFLQERTVLQMPASTGFGNRSHITRRFEMIANSSVRPNCSIGAITVLALCAASFVVFPVRADQPSADAAKDSQQALPKSLDNATAVEEMHDSVRNAKRLAVALHDWADAHEVTASSSSNSSSSGTSGSSSTSSSSIIAPYHFPPAVIYGKDGKGKYPHSWRVELLPYLKARELYDEYHFDEPWDSKANKNVLAKMPDIYRNPGDDVVSVNSAYYVLVGRLVDGNVEGPALQTFFSSKTGVAFRQVTDGVANTIAIVEAKRDIPWTKPEDIQYDPKQPPPRLGGFFKGGFCIANGDSSARFLEEPIKDSALKAMISPAAGDRIDYVFRRQFIPFGRPKGN